MGKLIDMEEYREQRQRRLDKETYPARALGGRMGMDGLSLSSFMETFTEQATVKVILDRALCEGMMGKEDDEGEDG